MLRLVVLLVVVVVNSEAASVKKVAGRSVTCDADPPFVPDATTSIGGTAEGDVVTYTVEFTSTCQNSGEWGDIEGFCPSLPHCSSDPPTLADATDDSSSLEPPYWPGDLVNYFCDMHHVITRTSICSTHGQWSFVTGCPVLVNKDETFNPTPEHPDAYFRSHADFPDGHYSPWVNRNFFFAKPADEFGITDCRPRVDFLGDFKVIGGYPLCSKDYVQFQQWIAETSSPIKVKKCGVHMETGHLSFTPWFENKQLRITFKTDGTIQSEGFLAVVSYHHCFHPEETITTPAPTK